MEPTSFLNQNYWTAALNYWRDPTDRSWILVCPASIGDTWIVCELAQAFRDTHGGPLTLVIKDSQKEIAQMFASAFDKIIVWEDIRLNQFCLRLMGQGAFAIDEPIIAHPYWHGIGRFYQPLIALLSYPNRGGLTVTDHFRLILQLSWESKLAQPVISEKSRNDAEIYADQLGLERGNSVILFPDSNSNPGLLDKFWEDLTIELINAGKQVFTNMAGNSQGPRQKPFKGSRPIEMTIRLGIPLTELAGRFIGMSNGFQWMLLSARVKAEHTCLIHDFPAMTSIPGPGFPVLDPIAWQRPKYGGLNMVSFNEFSVQPDQVSPQLIRDIAINNTRSMIKS